MDSVERGTLVVARYRLVEPVASDLDGVRAWEATDQILDRSVRVSLVDGDHAALTLDAARRAALVSDSHLTRVLDVLHDATKNVVVTEPYLGQTLAELVADGPLPAAQARAIIGQAAKALEVARRRGVHHGALRPASIRVHRGRVRVTGLGIDGALQEPDHSADAADRASRADTVGLVALLHFALTGVLPAAGQQARALHPGAPLPEHVQEPGEPLAPPREINASVPNDLDTLCVVTLGPNDDGPHTPGQLVTELAPWDEDDVPQNAEPETVGPPEPAPPTGVNRQSVRSMTGTSAGSSMPGTPPPAGPVRRTGTGRVPRVTAPLAAGAAAGAAASPSTGGTGVVRTSYSATRTGALPPSYHPVDELADHEPAAHTGSLDSLAPAPIGDRSSVDRTFSSMVPAKQGGRRMSINPTSVVLVLMIVLVVVGAAWAINSIGSGLGPAVVAPDGRPTEGTGDEAAAGGEEPPPAEEPAAAPPVITGGVLVDMPGAEQYDYPELAARAVDGDSTSAWYTRTYNTPQYGGLKEGVGLNITLEAPATVSVVFLSTENQGGNVQVRATDPANPNGGELLAEGPLTGETALQLAAPVETQSIVLWFTELPQAADGANRVHLYEVALS
ncbi:protein kinase family protein [Sanguibacter suaedae]|uniref:Protein kinase family protein n=1 Tax=Sanguibacter suaedae TaxID=2795737 RepID=A0A934IAD4_9MICO|nr:protein kinase family protein [Sanguibacter suaedae]MBI9114832.1 protein kinase family protein [Sanguibacter suaedae]